MPAATTRRRLLLAEALLAEGLRLVSGGTDNHLMLLDVTTVGLGGKKAEEALDACGITVNKNMIPFDTRAPLDPSGVRIGTPALTTRGMGEAEMRSIADWINEVLSRPEDRQVQDRVHGRGRQLCQQFPAPADQV